MNETLKKTASEKGADMNYYLIVFKILRNGKIATIQPYFRNSKKSLFQAQEELKKVVEKKFKKIYPSDICEIKFAPEYSLNLYKEDYLRNGGIIE